jgi:hypothetical protein
MKKAVEKNSFFEKIMNNNFKKILKGKNHE